MVYTAYQHLSWLICLSLLLIDFPTHVRFNKEAKLFLNVACYVLQCIAFQTGNCNFLVFFQA